MTAVRSDLIASAILPCSHWQGVLRIAHNNLLPQCLPTMKQMRIITVTGMQLTGKWFYNWTKVLACKYKKKRRKTSVLGNHKIYSRTHNYLQVDTEGYTEASYLLTHNKRRESLGHVIIIAGISPEHTNSIDSFLSEHLFFISCQDEPCLATSQIWCQ